MKIRNSLMITVLLVINYGLWAEFTYTVQKGDTLYSISRKYQISVSELMLENHIQDAKKVKVGTVLIIPTENSPTEHFIHVVQKGETLYSIAKQHGMAVETIIRVNGIKNVKKVKVGTVLKIPGKQKSSRSATQDDNEQHYWPIEGKREKLQGKIQGTKISGKSGELFYSVSSGKVIWVSPFRGYGKVVIVESALGYMYIYGGNGTIIVKVGDRVRQGTGIGELGLDPKDGTPTLLFSVFKEGKAINPQLAPRG